jgi:hypothetical protein
MQTILFSELTDLTAWLTLIDRQIYSDYEMVSTVYELYRKDNGFLLVMYRQDLAGVAQWGEFRRAEEALGYLPGQVAEMMQYAVRSID